MYREPGISSRLQPSRPAFAALLGVILTLLLPALGFAQDIGIYHADPSYVPDVQTKLQGSGAFTSITLHNANQATPSLTELQQYDAVLVYSNSSFASPVALGDVLADYVDAGGHVVLATFGMQGSSSSLGLQGRFISAGYAPITGSGQDQNTRLTLVKELPNHELLAGVNTFDGGSSSYHNASATLTSGAELVASWSNGLPLVAALTPSNGRTVSLNFFPPSSDIRSDFWESNTDGTQLMVNALTWGGGVPPVANADSYTTDEDALLDVSAPGVLGNDTDPDNDPLSVTGVLTDVAHGTLTLNADGSFTYTPDADFNGSDSFTYEISDGSRTASASVTLTITPVNDAPDAVDDTASGTEDTPVTLSPLDNDSDPEGDTLSVTATNTPAHGAVTINADNTITYTPNADFAGTDSFTYTVSDGNGGTDTAQVDVTLTGVNDAPDAVADTATTDEEMQVTIDLLANDVDVDGDTLTVTTVNTPANGTATDNGDGTVTYTPNANFNGTDSFSYAIADGNGSVDTAVVTITVNPINDAPVLTAPTPQGPLTVTEGTALTFVVAADDPDGDTLTYDVQPLPTGATIDAGTGDFNWTPGYADAGDHTLTLSASDGTASDSRDVTVTVSYLDADADGLPDTWETDNGLNPASQDSDGDGISDTDEVGDFNDPADTDADGTIDALDDDSDGDGLLDADEAGDDDPSTPAVDTDADGTPDYRDTDSDDDTVADDADNCPTAANTDQEDLDGDSIGDACDEDTDGDGVSDVDETAAGMDPTLTDSDSDSIGDGEEYADGSGNAPADTDADGIIDALDDDSDGDGLLDADEAGDDDPSTPAVDTDADGTPDYRDTDSDDDTVADDADNCRLVANADQADTDGNGTGDACDGDLDGDGIDNDADNCPAVANADQADLDADGAGDECDGDLDGDGVDNDADNCPLTDNAEQTNTDSDEFGDACDNDDDEDTVLDDADNCPLTANADQADADEDGIGDVCDDTPGTDTEPDTDTNTNANAAEDDGCGCSSTNGPSNGLAAMLALLFVLAPRLRRRRE
ncbi:Ig-like domain-containing protein [Persicimonas caeni]|nr:Ig-like domain-containing protein [Persicimonas caeni]